MNTCVSVSKHHAKKTSGGLELTLHIFPLSVLNEGELSPSRSDRFISGERAYSIRWTEGLINLSRDLNRKILASAVNRI
jgi:hypothetical protein